MEKTAHFSPPPPPPPPPAELDYFARGPISVKTVEAPNEVEASTPAQATQESAAPTPAEPTGPAKKPLGLRFKLFGIPIYINLSFIVVGFVLGYSPNIPLSFVAMFIGIITVSILWHELGHAFAFKMLGHEPEIGIFGIMGMTCVPSDKPISDGEKAFVCAAGPLANLVLALAAYFLRPETLPFEPKPFWHYVLIVNVFLSLYNMLPVYPFDGGQIMKSILQMVAPTWGERLAHVISLLVAAAAIWYAMVNEYQIAALVLLFMASVNFTSLRVGGASKLQAAQPV